jgi:hypothetical protein
VEVLKIFSLACGERLRYNIKIVSRVCMCAVDGMKAGMLLTIFNINILHLITSQFSLFYIPTYNVDLEGEGTLYIIELIKDLIFIEFLS